MAGSIWIEYELKKKKLKDLPREQYEKELDKLINEIDRLEKEMTFVCTICHERYNVDEIGRSEKARYNNICYECEEEGYANE